MGNDYIEHLNIFPFIICVYFRKISRLFIFGVSDSEGLLDWMPESNITFVGNNQGQRIIMEKKSYERQRNVLEQAKLDDQKKIIE